MDLEILCHQVIPLILKVLKDLAVQGTLQAHLVRVNLEIQENQVAQSLQLGQMVLESQHLQVIQLDLRDPMIQLVLEVLLVLEALVILAGQNCLHFLVVPKVQMDQADQLDLEIQRNQEIPKAQKALVVQLTLGHRVVPVALAVQVGLRFLCLQLHLEILVGLVDRKVLVSLLLPMVPEDQLDPLDLAVLDYLDPHLVRLVLMDRLVRPVQLVLLVLVIQMIQMVLVDLGIQVALMDQMGQENHCLQ